MIRHEYSRIAETMYEERLENGLGVFVFSKPEFRKSYAFFATRYGGMDTRFQLDGQWLDTPMGIAHYLEHKMFDMPDGGNALQTLSATGASPNAFTSTAITGYHFECTEALYEHHPVRNSVAGSVESIAQITAETLYHCHEAFYTPSNMVLCVAGNVDPEQVCAMAREILPKEAKPAIPRDHGSNEPSQVYCQEDVLTMEVAAPLLQIGVKLQAAHDGPAQLRQRLLGDLACDALVGSSSPLYNKLYAEGLINGSFYMGYVDYPGCAFLMAGGESKDPTAVRDAILEEATRLAKDGIDEAMFQRLKKSAYGAYVRSLNSFENLCVEQAQGYFANQDPWIFPEIYDALTAQEAASFLAQWVKPEQTALVVVRPEGTK